MLWGFKRALALLFTLFVGVPLVFTPEESPAPVERQISCAEDLLALSTLSESGHTFAGETILLTADIAVNDSLAPIGSPQAMFAGTFDGNGHTLSGLVLTGQEFCGLFGYIAPEGTVENLTLEDVFITGERYAGALTAYNAGTVRLCRVMGESRVSCTSDSRFGSAAGGITGVNTGKIEECAFSGVCVAGRYRVGGIAGYVSGGRVENCISAARIESAACGQADVGGIAGSVRAGGLLTGCHNRGDVYAPSAMWAGGIVGSVQKGKLRSCLNEGNVTAEHPAGGVAGYLSPDALSLVCLNNLRFCPMPPIGAGRSNSTQSRIIPYSTLDSLSLSSS